MPDSFDYTTGTNSENVRLLQALIDEAPEYTEETNSRNANILKSIINNTEYTDAPQSEIEELLLRLKAKIGGEIEVDELNVTENGTYDAGVNKAYNPVNVELPLNGKTVTENGTYTASDDNLAGFNEVTVAVEGYAKKSIPNTPTAIATFNASTLPMPSLTVGIEAVQSGTGDPSPTNVRPISGFSAVNVYDGPTTDPQDATVYTTALKDANDQPLTCYGGTLDVVNGVLTVEKASVDLGTLNYRYYSGNLFTVQISDLKPVPNEVLCDALCSIYVAKKGNEYSSIDGSFVAGFNNSTLLAIHDSRFTDATAFKQAMNGVQLVYELATPQQISQDSLSIATQEGTNNLWADSGDIQSGEYLEAL